ncbi:MAG: universal stress protein [Anaerolineae bacterium]|nr:MAG: universal stress protein [Anaerolineae bacterium]
MSLASYTLAVGDFRRARRKAGLQRILTRLAGKSPDLLSYEDVRRRLKAKETSRHELKEIPLDSIVGSVGRYQDFTRGFLPREDSGEDRWARVKVAVTELGGVPPIEVYQIGDVYFVLDGNHRVSVAREVGAAHIQAYVRQARTKVSLSPDIQPDDLILKAEHAEFLDRTSFDEAHPQTDLTVTAPGRYSVLEQQIEAHRAAMGEGKDHAVPVRAAAEAWYEEVYLPLVVVIREQGLLRDFPGRTETDLYVWITEHQAALERELGWRIKPESAAANLAAEASPRAMRRVTRAKEKLLDAITPDQLEAGPAPGKWRQAVPAARRHEVFTADILAAVSGEQASWSAVEQALLVARREGARLQGLHVVASRSETGGERARSVKAEFDKRCQAAGVPGRLVVESGRVARKIRDRARWTDLVVLHLAHPPGSRPLDRLGSGFRSVIHRCPRPILAVPGPAREMTSALLAYDGSPKSREALYLATYLAGRWEMPLVVVSVNEGERVTERTLSSAQSYIEQHGVRPIPVQKTGPVADAILGAGEEHDSDLFIMGGYGFKPVLEVVLGSAVDQVLREAGRPVLICR